MDLSHDPLHTWSPACSRQNTRPLCPSIVFTRSPVRDQTLSVLSEEHVHMWLSTRMMLWIMFLCESSSFTTVKVSTSKSRSSRSVPTHTYGSCTDMHPIEAIPLGFCSLFTFPFVVHCFSMPVDVPVQTSLPTCTKHVTKSLPGIFSTFTGFDVSFFSQIAMVASFDAVHT